MTSAADPLRAHLVRLLEWEEAHAGFDRAVAGLPPAQRGSRPAGFDHSPWQLLEHLRLAQRDLLDFCTRADYEHLLTWPDDYWPTEPAPSDADAWHASVAAFQADREALKRFIHDPGVDLFAPVPTGTAEQTVLRGVLLVADHTAYHVGQLIAVRRALGSWS